MVTKNKHNLRIKKALCPVTGEIEEIHLDIVEKVDPAGVARFSHTRYAKCLSNQGCDFNGTADCPLCLAAN